MAVTFIKSTDVGAPVLTGTEGDLITLLDYCLVTNSGWTKTFSDTNRGMYQYAAGQAYWKVDDNGGAFSGEGASIRGYMDVGVDMDTDLLNEFPTPAQWAWTGIKKSSTADATAREWVYLEDGGIVYLWIFYHATTYQSIYTFGKTSSEKANDSYDDILAVGMNTSENTTYSYVGFPNTMEAYFARSGDGITESKQIDSLFNGTIRGLTTSYGHNGVSELNGKLTLNPVVVCEEITIDDAYIRASLPGSYFIFEYSVGHWNSLDTFSIGSDEYIILKSYDATTVSAYYAIKTNGTWW